MNIRHYLLGAVMAVSSLAGFTPSALHAQTATSQASAPAYYIAEFELTDREGIRPYSERAEATFKAFGGRYIVRSNAVVPLEGEAPKSRIVIIAFDSVEQARAWYNSPAYSEIRPIRQRSGQTKAYIVEGLPN